jgi:Fe2+ transport system protein FeoA
MTCSYCGVWLDPIAARRACDACSLAGGGCRSVCCPRCGWEMPEEPAILARLRAWLGRRRPMRAGVMTLAEMAPGERGKVVKLDGHDASRTRKLMALGVLEGAFVELERTAPSVVFRTGYTQLAVDEGLAASIVVEVEV